MIVNYTKRRAIEDLVNDLLEEYDIKSAPVPVREIARFLDLPVVETEMDSDVSGALIRSGDLKGIAVNSAHAPVRKRFTIAHELGHFIRSHSDKDHVDRQFTILRRDGLSSTSEDEQEIEANYFAACLLMPKHLLRQDIERGTRYSGEIILGENDIELLAKKYRVSKIAMTYRLQNLGFIPCL